MKQSFLYTLLRINFIIVFFLFFLKTSFAQVNPSYSFWVGTLNTKDTSYYVKLLIDSVCKIHIPQLGLYRKAVQQFSQANNKISFGVEKEKETWQFNGQQLSPNKIHASIGSNSFQGQIELSSYQPVSSNEASTFTGAYKLENGNYVLVEPYSDGLGMINYTTGKRFFCWQISGNNFTSILPLHDVNGNASTPTLVSFYGNKISLIKQKEKNKKTLERGIKYDLYTGKDMLFQKDSLQIAGTLKRSKTGGERQPLILIVPGSGYLDRYWYHTISTYFASAGFSVFTYDKRGTGKSTGDENESSFEKLGDDVLYILDKLSEDPSIDNRNIFLWGHSQGGWLASMIANKTNKLAGLIIVSNPTDRPGVQTTYWVERYLTTKKFNPQDVQDAVNWMHLVLRVFNDNGEGYENIDKNLTNVKSKSWGNFVTIPTSKENLMSRKFYLFDPVKMLNELKMPILSIYGGVDILVNAKTNAVEMQRIIGKKNKYNKVVTFKGANHSIMLAPTGNGDLDDPFEVKGYAPGYLNLMKEWLDKVIAGNK